MTTSHCLLSFFAEATMKKLPHTTRSQLGTAINSKLTEMRLRQKNSLNILSCNFLVT